MSIACTIPAIRFCIASSRPVGAKATVVGQASLIACAARIEALDEVVEQGALVGGRGHACSIRSIGQPATSLLSSPQLWLIWPVTSAWRLWAARAVARTADAAAPATGPLAPA